MSDEGTMKFLAEIKQVSSKTVASLDKEYRVVLAGEDPAINDLGLIPPQTLVEVTVEVQNG